MAKMGVAPESNFSVYDQLNLRKYFRILVIEASRFRFDEFIKFDELVNRLLGSSNFTGSIYCK